MKVPFRHPSICVCLALSLLSAPVVAQSLFGSILGTITDNSQSVVVAATVRIRSIDTNTIRTVKTDASGNFQAPALPVGLYEVSCEHAGFKRSIVSGVKLEVDQRARVDIRLELGAVEQQVQITATASIIEADTASQGTVIDNQRIVELPLNGRNFEQLAVLAPGVIAPVAGAGNDAYFSVAGTRGLSNSFMMDGASNTNSNANVSFIRPSVDLIEEFKIQRNTFNAEYGRGAAQINVVTKSGTNTIRFTLFEFLRNNALNARNFFEQQQKPALRRNQFGGTIGGPVLLPKLYNGRNKTFWLFNSEGVRQRSPVTRLSAIPTQAQLSGDLSTVAAASVRDPFTGVVFPNKQIPASRIDPTSKIFQRYIPSVTTLPGSAGPGINLVTPISTINDFDQFTIKMDQQLNSNTRAFARYSRNATTNITPGILREYTTAAPAGAHNAVAGLNQVIRPTLINEFRASYSRNTLHQGPGFKTDINFAQLLGLKNTMSRDPEFNALPTVAMAGYTSLGGAALITQRGGVYTYLDNLTWIKRAHTLKFGGDIRLASLDVRNIGATQGSFGFTGTLGGNSIADFLLGTPATANAAAPPGPDGLNHSAVWQGFAQDDWKVRDDLTLNLGIRYEYQSPFTNDRGQRSIFDATFPGGRLIYGGASRYFVPGKGFTQTSEPLTPPGLVPPDRNNFAPRFGFAWRPFGSRRNVVRGSYGIFYEAQNANNDILFGSFNYPNQLSYALTNDVLKPSLIWSNVFPAEVTLGAIGFNSLDKRMPLGYIQQWSFNLQRELRPNLALEIGYLGSKGTKLDWRNNMNQAVLDADPASPTSLISRQPYPAFAIGSTIVTRNGFSHYNAMIVRLERKFSNGLQFLAAYTFSKSIDNSSFAGNIGAQPALPANAYSRSNEKGLSFFDVPHRFVISYVWNIPFNPGRGVVRPLLGGWQLSGITQTQTGNPWSILLSGDTANVGTANQRAQQVGEVYPSDFVSGGPSRLAFNPKAFAVPARGTFGNTGRNIVRTASMHNWDVAINKRFKLTEKARLEFRSELFNTWNHTQFLQFENTFQSVAFGTWSNARAPRIVQFGMKLNY